MIPQFDTYPVFEANQVLSSKHLNDVFDYLDQQSRLTRSRLVGIGIVCGFEVRLSKDAILLSKGCGVTSAGYLVLQPTDVELTSYRTYKMPMELDYPPFKTPADLPLTLWEIFPAGEPDTTPLSKPTGFLDDKGVVLFLELNKQPLRNCSPNNCDDKGSQVTVTVRRLLARREDLDKLIATANAVGTDLTTDDLDAALSAKLNLADIKVPRFDAPNTNPVTSADVYAAFLRVFGQGKLAATLADALTACYQAFKPLLVAEYPTNPFANFAATYGSLDTIPASTQQVRFLQYYVDLFEDVVRAYDEFRWRGIELLCGCCPDEGLFPRHLMLGMLQPKPEEHPGKYRHAFLPSPATDNCAELAQTVVHLFRRLVEMTTRFTSEPGLPPPNVEARIDPQIRVTPSVLGDEPIEKRAIPYYYRQNGSPPLYRLWSIEKTRRHRANQNLGYRYDEYQPFAPAFVSDPLRFDLEPYDFLRVEGHLGKNYQQVLSSLLALRTDYRLPIDVIALRTGAYDDTQAADGNSAAAYFQDLEALYDSLREELLASLAQGALDLYDVPVAGSEASAGTPALPLLKKFAPHYRYQERSVGAFYEANLNRFTMAPYIDVDQTRFSEQAFAREVLKVYCTLFSGLAGLPPENFAHVVSVFYFSKLAEILPLRLDALGYADFANKYEDLRALVRYFRNEASGKVPADLKSFVPQARLIEQLDQVLYACQGAAIKAIYDEYGRRLSELKKMQFLSTFLRRHPGIQHKAGAPIGGTLILVYHSTPRKGTASRDRFVADTMGTIRDVLAGQATSIADRVLADRATTVRRISDAIDRISANALISRNPDVEFLIGSLTGRIPETVDDSTLEGLSEEASRVIARTVGELRAGDIIADFYLPYRVFGDTPCVQFVLPRRQPLLTASLAGTTNQNRLAPVKIEIKGGVAPYELSIDNGPYQALQDPLMLFAGTHVLRARDAEAMESNECSLAIPEPITFGEPEFTCENVSFTVKVQINGGTPPYTVNGVGGIDTTFTSPATASGGQVTLAVTDSANATAQATFSYRCPPPCQLPCSGESLRRGYRFWLPEPESSVKYMRISHVVPEFIVKSSPDKDINLSEAITKILDDIDPTNFVASFNEDANKTIQELVARINSAIRAESALYDGTTTWLTLRYESQGAGRLGNLWIEHFSCLDFKLRVTGAVSRRDGVEEIEATYTPKEMTVDKPHRFVVPAFDGHKINKCLPGMPEEPICNEPPQIALTVSKKKSENGKLTFDVTAFPPSNDLQFLWEVQRASPPIGNGSSFDTQLPADLRGGLTIFVTAFTPEGCSVSHTKKFGP